MARFIDETGHMYNRLEVLLCVDKGGSGNDADNHYDRRVKALGGVLIEVP